MAFSELEFRAERIWTYALTNDSIIIVARMGIKRLSVKGIVGTGTVQGGGTVNNGVTTYTSAAQNVVAGDVNTLQASEGYFIDGYTITAPLGVTIYLEGII